MLGSVNGHYGEALREVKLELLEDGVHPRDWAPFVLIGETRGAVFEARATRPFGPAAGAIGAAGLVLLGWMIYARRRRARRSVGH